MYVSDIKYQYIFTFKFTCRINKKIPNMLTIIKESASNMFKNMGIPEAGNRTTKGSFHKVSLTQQFLIKIHGLKIHLNKLFRKGYHHNY